MSGVRMGQHSPASHLIAHISDTHFLGNGRPLYGTVDTTRSLHRAMEQLERSGLRPDAIVFTGDITDKGEPDAYSQVMEAVEPTATRLGSALIWVMGNHDERSAFRTGLLGEAGSAAPVDSVVDVKGLRVIVLDTSVPGYHHGDLSLAQIDWLRDVLAEPAEQGTLLALHHPPVPTPLPLMDILELRNQTRLAEVVSGSDIRAILGGHLHYATTGLFAGIPVSVAAATCYTMDLSAPHRELTGIDGGQSVNLVHVYGDQVVHSVVPLGRFPVATHFGEDFLARMEVSSGQERIEAFSHQA